MRWITLALVFLGIVVNYADKSIIGFAAGPIMKEFHLTYTQWGLVGSSFFWLFSIAGLIGAGWSDKIGTKKVMGHLLVAWTVLQFGALAIVSFPILILQRVLLGVGEGPYAPTFMSHINKWFKPELRGMALSICSAGSTVGGLVLAPVLVWLIIGFGWRNAFVILGIASLVLFLIWAWLAKEKPQEESVKDVVLIEESAPAKKLTWSLMLPIIKSPTFIFTLLASFSGFWVASWTYVWMPIYLTKVIHLSMMNVGYISSIIGIASAVTTVIISVFSDRIFKKYKNFRLSRIVITGISFVAAAFFFASTTIIHNTTWTVIAFSLGKGFTLLYSAMAPMILIRLLPSRPGLMSSCGTSFMNLAGVVGPMVTGIIVQFAGSNPVLGFNYSVMLISALLFIFGITLTLFVNPDKKANIIDQKVEAAQITNG